jgi:hypothetical protein
MLVSEILEWGLENLVRYLEGEPHHRRMIFLADHL